MQWFDPCSNLHSNSDVYMDSNCSSLLELPVTGHWSLGNVTEVLNQRVHHTKNFLRCCSLAQTTSNSVLGFL